MTNDGIRWHVRLRGLRRRRRGRVGASRPKEVAPACKHTRQIAVVHASKQHGCGSLWITPSRNLTKEKSFLSAQLTGAIRSNPVASGHIL